MPLTQAKPIEEIFTPAQTMDMLVPGIESLKSRLRATWMAGDYDRFSRFMENDARSFYERLDVPPGAHLLDVACGSGQLALIAAREGVRVTGVDIAENLIERAQARSTAENLPARFRIADAESLPFSDASFDVVVSLIGAMFAPRPHLVARELTRVCVPGGTIAMANWTAGGFVGSMFKTIAKFIAPSGMPSPVLWGDEATVRERFGAQVFGLTLTRRYFTFDYPFPPSDVVHFFRLYYGPVNRAFSSLDRAGRKSLHQELEALWSAHNRGRDGFTLVAAEYLEVIATRA
ncbi:MAG TPA: methyltransferase domain-containing protein [Bryobacteraceae bacterium]|nr:methyltransferase domain-containing protein [Bryobacteraceae bacterium]